jgi:hypothetical protein
MKTSDKLIYTASKIKGNEKIDITIRLDEKCKNGYEYFSATCRGYEKAKNGRWFESFGGCAHDEIIRFFPELKIFTEVHLWSFGGFSTHSVANGFYFLKSGFDKCGIDNENFAQYYCNYFKCSAEQFEILKDSENKFEFSVLLVELGIVAGWKKIVNNAIAELEKLTGLKFQSKYEKDKNDISINADKLKEFRQQQKEGFYTAESKQEREKKRLSDLNKAMIDKVNADYKKSVSKHENERQINLELIRQGFEISPRTGNIKGAIYYNHSNELNFNWSTEKIHESIILDFANNLDTVKFEGLKISNDKKHLITI